MGQIVFISGATVVVFFALWYFCWAHYNRQKGINALRWIETACLGHARIVEQQWNGISRLHARIRFAALWLENACVTVRLSPRPVPVSWALSAWRKQRETLTFEADLDCPPGVHLELLRHRWVTHKHISTRSIDQNWLVSRPGPVILTTRSEWSQELTPVVNTLMTSRGHHLLSVRFRQDSPHLAATIDLDALSGEETAAAFLGVLRELAASASAHRQ